MTDNAEGEILARIDQAIIRAGVDPNVKGNVNMLQSNPTGVCPGCKSGLPATSKHSTGVIKQFSLKYPNLKITIQTEGGVKPDLVVLGGVKLS